MKRKRHYSGFTLLEVLAVTLVLSLFVTSFYIPRFQSELRSYQNDLATRTGEEIYQLGVYAQNFIARNNGDWPDAANNCYNAIRTMQSGGFLPTGVDFASAPVVADKVLTGLTGLSIDPSASVRAGRYYTDCRANMLSGRRDFFRITYIVPAAQEDAIETLLHQLPNTRSVRRGTHNTLETIIPPPSAVPIVESMLPRDGTRAMTGDLDLGGNTVVDAENILLSNGASLGNQLIDSIVVSPGTVISKPVCISGHTPVITLAPADVFLRSGAPVTRVRLWAEDDGLWTVRSQVVGADGVVENNERHIQAVATVACVSN